jgi:hypothetical protein
MNILVNCIFVLSVFFVGAADAVAQAPDIEWTNTYGGDGHESVYSIQKLPTGYVLAGYTSSYGAGNGDFWLIRTDLNGDSLWTRTYGDHDAQLGKHVIVSSDGDFVMTGRHEKSGLPRLNVWLVKPDANGNSPLYNSYGETYDEFGECIVEADDGGFAIAGYVDHSSVGTSYDVLLVRTNAGADSLWIRSYGGTGNDEAYHVDVTNDGGFVVAGWTGSFGAGHQDVWLIRTDANGDTLWTRTYGGTRYDYGYCVRATDDGGFVVAGKTFSYGAGDYDMYLVKTNADGDVEWTGTYGGTKEEVAWDVRVVNNGYVLVGTTETLDGLDTNVFVVRTNLLGDTLWTKSIVAPGYQEGNSIVACDDGGYAIAAITKTDFIAAHKAWLVKLGSDPTGVATPGGPLLKPAILKQNHPNPFNPTTTIEYALPAAGRVLITVHDAAGRKLTTLVDDYGTPGEHIVPWEARGLASGVYFVRLNALGKAETIKTILLK